MKIVYVHFHFTGGAGAIPKKRKNLLVHGIDVAVSKSILIRFVIKSTLIAI